MAAFNANTNYNVTRASNSSRTRSNSAFIRELWSDEVIATYKAALVMPQLVVRMPFTGKKGDTVHIPKPVRGSASAKVTETPVTLVANQASENRYVIDDHWEYSSIFEDIMSIQAEDGLRSFVTDDAGYALATRVDTALHTAGRTLNGAGATPTSEAGSSLGGAVAGTPTSGALVTWSASANSNTGNGATISEEGLRLLIRELDDNDVPSMDRVLVIPPVEKMKILGIPRFTEQAFVGEGGSIRNGKLGSLYGVDVYVSTNCGSVTAADTTTTYRVAYLLQKQALVLFEQLAPRVQTQYKQEWLGDLFTADILFDTGILRPEAGIPIIVPR